MKIKIENKHNDNTTYEIWKENRKGFYNFVEYTNEIDLKQLKKRFKRHTIIDKRR